MADPTIYSFDWSQSCSEYPSNQSESLNSSMSTSSVIQPIRDIPPPRRSQSPYDYRRVPPTLPRSVSWATITHPEIFATYIKAECLGHRPSSIYTMASIPPEQIEQHIVASTQELPEEPASQNLSNINDANTDKCKVVKDVDFAWVYDDLFPNKSLPIPFNRDLVETSSIWRTRDYRQIGDVTFTKLIDTSSEEKAVEWLNDTARSLVTIHDIPSSKKDHGDRMFDHRGPNKPLTGGHIKRKHDIVIIDRTIAEMLPDGARIRWPVVQALVEVSTVNNHQAFMVQTLLSKASVIFESQLHRRYILGLAFFGKGNDVRFFIMLIDRAGGVCTKPELIQGYVASLLARIIFAFACGCDKQLGADDRITINRLTGHPIQVVVEEQLFTIVQELHVSPYLFGNGTRVYIVKDTHGHFHIFKDSWISTSHESSEIDYIKKISDTVTAEDSMDIRSQFLMPRFVAGEDHADDTNLCRGLLTIHSPGRVRRRIITGPIGDPITSYRSRVECLQAFIDIVNQLGFLHDKCGLVHGDISINNVVIVRFLPSILAASHAAKSKLSSPTTALNPATYDSDSLSYGTEDNTLLPWETVKATGNDGLLGSLGSGGSVIDFDYSCPINTTSWKTTGTMPYMSVQLMNPSAPIDHRLVHDLESVLMVLLHIFRFTCGPTRDPSKEVKSDFNISLWHYESVVELVKDRKQLDIHNISRNPTQYITNYWAPIGDDIIKLIELIYCYKDRFTLDNNGTATCEAFNAILMKALDHCKELDAKESPPNYAAILDFCKAPY